MWLWGLVQWAHQDLLLLIVTTAGAALKWTWTGGMIDLLTGAPVRELTSLFSDLFVPLPSREQRGIPPIQVQRTVRSEVGAEAEIKTVDENDFFWHISPKPGWTMNAMAQHWNFEKICLPQNLFELNMSYHFMPQVTYMTSYCVRDLRGFHG